MNPCATCGNVYDKAFQIITADGESLFFDSFECAIQRFAPRCQHCGCRIIGHGTEALDGSFYCCANCAHHAGVLGLEDRQRAKRTSGHSGVPGSEPTVPAGLHV